ncbi:MAG TPA: aminofutalosine synthase MqnE [Thermodesulfovibrionales bacterium]|nr:aminofutalosine synthase MqnE [Thermodesulfovibrionales bacterium]
MLTSIRKKVLAGKRISEEDALHLFESDDIFTLGALASHIARKKNGPRAFFIRNRHINPTNICINRCKFCAFSRSPGEDGAFELTIEDIIGKLGGGQEATGQGRGKNVSGTGRNILFSEVHIVGGLHPDWPLEHYLEMLSSIKKRFPKLHIKAFTAVEIDYFSKISGLSVEDTLRALKKSGLGSMPGGGAEIFGEGIRNQLCPEKISGDRWLEVMETANRVGIRTNATMLYGHVEDIVDRVDHLSRLRSLQDRTKGFQAFIPLAYHPKNTEMEGSYTSGIDDLKTIAVGRIFLDNFDHIKAYWIMLGEKISQLALLFGADDIDGTIIEEKITHSAGALTGEKLVAEQLVDLIRKAGRVAVERDSFYRTVRTYR